jgi:predicted transcriptional regulator of viral defense system
LTLRRSAGENQVVPRSRFGELVSLAEENDGLVTADHARQAGFTDSVLARLVQRGRIERTSRGVYRVPYLTPGRFSQYREAVLWAKANRGPTEVALSYTTALAAYEISSANPHSIHITAPRAARLKAAKAERDHSASRRPHDRGHYGPRGNADHDDRQNGRGPSEIR